MKEFVKNFSKGIQVWLWIVSSAVLVWWGISFAAATWGNLPDATTGTPLSSSAWNDLVAQVNGLAGAISVNSGNAGISAGKTFSSGKIQLLDSVTAGSACSPAGLLARNSAGVPFSCQSGTWVSMTGAQWPTGATGPAGPTGATGPQGPAGNGACPTGQTLSVCLYHEHYSPVYGWSNSGWQCAPLGTATAKVWFGDDTWYTNQSAQVKIVCQ